MTETNEKVEPKPIDLGEYKYGFHDDVTPVFSTGKGISEDVVRAMSAEKLPNPLNEGWAILVCN